MPKAKTKKRSLGQILPWILVIGGLIGLIAATQLTLEKFHLLENPGAELSCDINPIVACGSVISSDQAKAFNFPNPMLGLSGFAVLITIGMAMFAGGTFKRWFWLGLEAGTIFGVLFVHWLIYQSLYTIGALCPYCMVVWTVTIPIFWYTTLYNLNEGNIKVSKKLKPASEFVQKYHAEILLVWFLIIIGLILNKFWYYWSTLV
jgi:uncharacterized membrane protein